MCGPLFSKIHQRALSIYIKICRSVSVCLSVCLFVHFFDLLPIVQVGVATHLAVEHLNSGNGVIIPEVEGLNERCPIRFTTEMIDSKRSSSKICSMFHVHQKHFRRLNGPRLIIGGNISFLKKFDTINIRFD